MKDLRIKVIEQLGGKTNFNDQFEDVANYGAEGGFSGFITYKETFSFTKRNKRTIMHLAKQQAEDFGVDLLTFFSGFNCFKELTKDEIARGLYSESKQDEDIKTIVYNGLAWFALEEVCRAELDQWESMIDEVTQQQHAFI